MLDALADGLIAVANGAVALLSMVASPATLLVSLAAASLAWMALCEIDELDRSSHKPDVPRH